MSAIDQVFKRLKAEGKTAFMPFITAGDPDLAFTGELLRLFSDVGCHLVELGFPYSDPIADGPTIQSSYTRALKTGIKTNDIFKTLKSVQGHLKMPVVAMVSYAIIFRHGVDEFLRQAIDAGFAGAIVPDLPVDESKLLAEKSSRIGFDLIQLITPTTTEERTERISATSTGFIYYVSIAGITGERSSLPSALLKNLDRLRQQTDKPICVGFGISKPEQAQLLAPHVDGIIVGSAIVRRIESALETGAAAQSRTAASHEVVEFVKTMIDALAH
jgi:tryptophan synthase alpha chain